MSVEADRQILPEERLGVFKQVAIPLIQDTSMPLSDWPDICQLFGIPVEQQIKWQSMITNWAQELASGTIPEESFPVRMLLEQLAKERISVNGSKEGATIDAMMIGLAQYYTEPDNPKDGHNGNGHLNLLSVLDAIKSLGGNGHDGGLPQLAEATAGESPETIKAKSVEAEQVNHQEIMILSPLIGSLGEAHAVKIRQSISEEKAIPLAPEGHLGSYRLELTSAKAWLEQRAREICGNLAQSCNLRGVKFRHLQDIVVDSENPLLGQMFNKIKKDNGESLYPGQLAAALIQKAFEAINYFEFRNVGREALEVIYMLVNEAFTGWADIEEGISKLQGTNGRLGEKIRNYQELLGAKQD